MKKSNLDSLFYSAGGLVLLAIILIAANFLFSAFKARVDLTQGSVYTLSEGTRVILSKLEAPVKIRYYYTQGGNTVPVGIKTFAKRVEDLLAEYKAASGGKVIIEKFNPEPDSDAEESAALDNVEGQQTNTGEKFYLGLSVSFLDKKEAIPVLSADRERLLEYDLTSKISQVTQAKKPVIGLMAGLPVLGRPLNPMTKQQPTEPWVLGAELKRTFEVRKIELDVKKIDDDIKVLLVIHPKNITEEAEYAIDQFVLRGGKLVAFVDPYAYFDQQPDMQNPFGGNQAGGSTLYNLFKGWGVEVDSKVLADMTFPSGSGPRLLPTLLMLTNDAFNMDDIVMSQVGTMLVPFGGSFKGKLADGLKQNVLIKSSKNAMPVDLIIATLSGEPATRGFAPTGKEEPIAIQIGVPQRRAHRTASARQKRRSAGAAAATLGQAYARSRRRELGGAGRRRGYVDRRCCGRSAGCVRAKSGGAAQRQPRFRARPGGAAGGRPESRHAAQPRRVQQTADGAAADGSASAAVLSGRNQKTRRCAQPDHRKIASAAKRPHRCRRRSDCAHAGAAGRDREIPQAGDRHQQAVERVTQKSARRHRPVGVGDQGD